MQLNQNERKYDDYNEQKEKNELENGKEKQINNIKNNIKRVNTDNTEPKMEKHKKCVPLEIYQKVYNDKQKLLDQLEIINNKLQSQMPDEKIKLISALQSKIKIIEKSNKSLENIVIKQEKIIINFKSKIVKYEKLLSRRNDELLIKENNINELKETIEELIEKNKNIKNNIKINEKNEIFKMNDLINNLKNELEIKDKKLEFSNNKFNILQIKYLKLAKQKKKDESDFLLKLSKEQMLNKAKNNYENFQMKTMENTNCAINNNQTININNDLTINLPKINENSLSISINKENNNHSTKNKIINVKKSYNITNNNK